MRILYQFGIFIYSLLIEAIAPFYSKAWMWANGRKKQHAFWIQDAENETREVIWFHCASLGEFEQARPVIEKVKELSSNYAILVTFFSPSGFEIRKNYEHADYVYYLPTDTEANAQKWVGAWKLKMALFVKYEFWHFYTSELVNKKVPLYSFSSIFRANQVFFKFYGGFFAAILKRFNHLYVQNEESKQLLSAIGIGNVSIAGDTRFDRVLALLDEKLDLPIIEDFTKGIHKVIVLGSTWENDLDTWKPIVKSFIGRYKIIIAPHEIKEENLKWIEDNFAGEKVRYTEYQIGKMNGDILIMNNIGLLSSAYKFADVVYVGGAFGKGLHNILEAATYGKPVIFGPKYKKFQEAVDLVGLGGAFSIQNSAELNKIVLKLLTDKQFYNHSSEIAQKYVSSNFGATDKILSGIGLGEQ